MLSNSCRIVVFISIAISMGLLGCESSVTSFFDSCNTDADCSNGFVCEQGICVVGTADVDGDVDIDGKLTDGDLPLTDGDAPVILPDGDKDHPILPDGDDEKMDGDQFVQGDGDLPIDGDVPANGDLVDSELPIDGDLPSDGDLPIDGDLNGDGDLPIDGDWPVDGDLPIDGDQETNLCENVDCAQDDNPCTFARCNPDDGRCYNEFEPAGVCSQDDNPCTHHQCDSASLACVAVNDDGGNCNDGDLCNGEELCSQGQCEPGEPVVCSECYSCDPQNGECVCDPGSCNVSEVCNMMDDNCDGNTDEGGVCDDADTGLRVELRWSLLWADLDLHVLREGGVLGGQTVDPNDCYYNNANPDWGVIGEGADDPQFGDDRDSGGGLNWRNSTPETVHIGYPTESYYRVLIHYARKDYWPYGTDVEVRVIFNGQVMQTFNAGLDDRNSYWNIACIRYENGEVSAILNDSGGPQISYGDMDGIDSLACEGHEGDSCTITCDCNQGMDCVDGACRVVDPPVYCCEKADCPMGQACIDSYSEPFYCEAVIDFDHGPAGQSLGNAVNVEALYSPYGVRFDTPMANAIVATDASWELESWSGNNACSTLTSNGQRWTGDILVSFITPQDASISSTVPAVTWYAGFYSGETHDNQGLRVRAYDLNGVVWSDLNLNKVYDAWINDTGWVDVSPDQPMHMILIETHNDPNFVIDDLYYPGLSVP